MRMRVVCQCVDCCFAEWRSGEVRTCVRWVLRSDCASVCLFFCLDNEFVPLNTRCPLSANIINISSATLSHEPSGSKASVVYHFSSDPDLRNDRCLLGKSVAFRHHVRNYVYNLFIVCVVPIDVVVHKHEDDSILEICRQNIEFFLHNILDFTEERQRSVSWEKKPTGLVLQSCPVHDEE